MSKALGIAFAGGVSVWAGHLLLSYLLADLGCRGDSWLLLAGRHALTVAAVVLVIVVTVAVRRYLGSQGLPDRDGERPDVSTGAGSASIAARPFLARVALILNALFLFAIVMAGAMSLFVASCV